VVRAEVPGIDPQDLDLRLDGEVLPLAAEPKNGVVTIELRKAEAATPKGIDVRTS
jgi:HSP20 family molecular chaperone IbpA